MVTQRIAERPAAPRRVESSVPAPARRAPFQVEIYFELGRASVSNAALDGAIAWLRSHPDARLVVEGHTDSSGSAGFNQRLSLQRARAVRGRLVERAGIDGSRVKAVGYGERRIADPDDASKNRRVVIRSK